MNRTWKTGAAYRPQSSTLARERALGALAARQHGRVSRAQVLSVGFGAGAIKRRLAAGRLHAVHRGVYAVGHPCTTREANWMAAVLACGHGALLSHRDAGALRALRPAWGSRINVTVPTSRRPNPHGIHVHRSRLRSEDMTIIDGIPVTSLARTLLDLAAILRPHQLPRAIEAAERRRLLDFGPLRAVLTSNPRHPGARQLRAALATYTEGTITHRDHEALLLHLCVEAGLPRPQTNSALTLKDGSTIRPDLL